MHMLKDKVLEMIKKYNLIQQGDIIVVGLSGGPDSVCLLHMLWSFQQLLNIQVHAVHINHLLRGEESEEDQQYAKELCLKLKIPLHCKAVNIKELSKQQGISLESAGREARYEEFYRYADTVGAAVIAVAHNKNDQAETVLMNLIRGTGLDGLKGMEYKRGRIIRPLLGIERSEIEEYCAEALLNPRTDSSNLKSIFTRNKIRLQLVPYINKLFETNIVESVYRMSTLLTEDYNYIEQEAVNLYNRCVIKKEGNTVWLDLRKIGEYQAESIRKRIFRNAVKEVKGNLTGIESIHIEHIMELCESGRTGTETHLPGNIRVEKSYDVLKVYILEFKKESAGFEKELNVPGLTLVSEFNYVVEACIEKFEENSDKYWKNAQNSSTQLFDYEKLQTGINIRNRKNGDVFKPFKSNGTKKLKEYFIDNKIPRDLRGQIPLIAKDHEVVWVIGYKISDKFKVTENTKRVLKLIFKKMCL